MGQELSIQEHLYPQLTCFGCGHANARGLKLRSYPGDGVVTAAFEPWPEHDNGFGFLNGGIIATVLDCHSGAAVFHRASLLGMEPEQGAPLLYVTAGLDLRYLRPVPLDQVLELRAAVVSADDDQVTVEAELVWDAKPRAAATTRWKRWRPR
ncbi:MAG: PaaI family thioesterase [Candidatus Nanopelagicales bacterium]|jgi:acyl-coenzyme A thioesterase PaaI-like protein|nr:PaaI family thioesterase [Candidatus Nanopelagicales bacterium]